jgi:hypothetical protein
MKATHAVACSGGVGEYPRFHRWNWLAYWSMSPPERGLRTSVSK